MTNRNTSIITTTVLSWVQYERICLVSCNEHETHPFFSHSYKIIYWDTVDKQKKKKGKLCLFSFSVCGFKNCEETHNLEG